MSAEPAGAGEGGRSIARSLGAVAVGFLYALAGIWFTQFILWFAVPGRPREDGAESVPEARLLGSVLCTFASTVLAGFMTAHVARRAELLHGLAVGTLVLAVLAITMQFVMVEGALPWYQLTLPSVALPGALLGALLRILVRRHSPLPRRRLHDGSLSRHHGPLSYRHGDLSKPDAQPPPCRHGRPGHDLRRDLSARSSSSSTPRGCTAATSAWSRWSWPPSPAAPAAAPDAFAEPAASASSPASPATDALQQLLEHGVDVVCVATPDDRHFDAAQPALAAGKHVLIEKPSVLRLQELDELDGPRPQARRAGQGRLSQAGRSRSQEAAHARRRRRADARQQRLLLAAGAEADQRQAVRRVDHRPQPGHLCRRPLHQADRLHVRRPRVAAGPRRRQRAARPGRPGRRADLGLGAAADGLRLSRRPRGGLRHPHRAG